MVKKKKEKKKEPQDIVGDTFKVKEWKEIADEDKPKIPPSIELIPKEKAFISSLFLDSGAFSLFTHFVKKNSNDKYGYFDSDEFWKFVDAYGKYVSENLDKIDYYANVDVIRNPEISWKVLKYLEKEYKISPMPVVHYLTPLKWLIRHLDDGYTLIGLGGIGVGVSASSYKDWADSCFRIICDSPNKLPRVRVHGFAMTTYQFLIRYPWWSVDSTSWIKWPAYGIIYVPRWDRQKGEFHFPVPKKDGTRPPSMFYPQPLFVSQESPRKKELHRHISNVSTRRRNTAYRWLKEIKVPFGSRTEWGVTSSGDARAIANLRFFERIAMVLPDWPWPFWGTAKPKEDNIQWRS